MMALVFDVTEEMLRNRPRSKLTKGMILDQSSNTSIFLLDKFSTSLVTQSVCSEN
jgi:hypothetical protein